MNNTTIRFAAFVLCFSFVLSEDGFAQGKKTNSASVCADCVQLHQAAVTLNDDQIRHLPSVGVDVVAAPGAERVIVPVSVFMVLDATAGAYVSDPGASWLFQYEGGVYATAFAPIAGVINLARVSHYIFSTSPYQIDSTSLFGMNAVIGNGFIGYPVQSINKNLQIKDDWNGVSDYAGGNPANTLKISVAYLIVNTLTGQFE